MNRIEKETFRPEETFALAKELAEQATGGEVICLDGDLGVGKTVLFSKTGSPRSLKMAS